MKNAAIALAVLVVAVLGGCAADTTGTTTSDNSQFRVVQVTPEIECVIYENTMNSAGDGMFCFRDEAVTE